METIRLDDFLSDGLIREKEFRKIVSEFDWAYYTQKRVIIKGCASVEVPTWAYLMIVSHLSQYANRIYFGAPCSAVEIFKK